MYTVAEDDWQQSVVVSESYCGNRLLYTTSLLV
jgi:hypothetical protein